MNMKITGIFSSINPWRYNMYVKPIFVKEEVRTVKSVPKWVPGNSI